jgi:hypothetical protein
MDCQQCAKCRLWTNEDYDNDIERKKRAAATAKKNPKKSAHPPQQNQAVLAAVQPIPLPFNPQLHFPLANPGFMDPVMEAAFAHNQRAAAQVRAAYAHFPGMAPAFGVHPNIVPQVHQQHVLPVHRAHPVRPRRSRRREPGQH